jgi:hypothetical protein
LHLIFGRLKGTWAQRDFLEDPQLGLLGSNPPVGRVILTYHVETNLLHDERPVDEKAKRILLEVDTEELLRIARHSARGLMGKILQQTSRFKKH